MDIKITDKDIDVAFNGEALSVDGMDQAVQQVKIAMGVNANSFIYDRSYGVDYSNIDFNSDDCKKELEALINEKLFNVKDVYVKISDIITGEKGRMVKLTVYNKFENRDIEVSING